MPPLDFARSVGAEPAFARPRRSELFLREADEAVDDLGVKPLLRIHDGQVANERRGEAYLHELAKTHLLFRRRRWT